MTAHIFADTAPAYWAKGLPVIPLARGDKMPVIDGWQFFAERLPTIGEQENWLRSHGDGNIGLVLGPQSGLVMLDIDTEDARLQSIIMECLQAFPSPWKRVGSKGMVLAYRQPLGGTPLKTFRIRRLDMPKENASVIEGLSTRTQVVLPPSLHPKGMYYSANCELLDVLDQLPHIPFEIEKVLRQALIEEGEIKLSLAGSTRVTDYVSVGARDTAMVSMAGIWAQGITRGEISLLTAISRMHDWSENLVERVAGDEIDVKKGVKQIIGFLTRDVLERKKTLPAGWDAGMDEDMKKGLGLVFDEEHEEWTYDQIMTYLQTEFEKHGAKTEGWIRTAEYILERLSRSKNISGLYEEQILKYIAESSGRTMTIGTIRKRMREMRLGDVRGEDHTEIAKAVLADMQRFGEMRFDLGKFWQWSGSHWTELEEDRIMLNIAENFGSMQAARRRSDHGGIAKVMATLCKKELKSVSIPGVNFANGFLTDELQLIPHSADFGCNYTLPFRYLPELADKAIRFFDFLTRSFGDPEEGPDPDRDEKIAAIQEAMCVTLFGRGPSMQRAILLYGLSQTGKSQLLNIVQELVPESARAAIPPNDWADKFLPAELAGRLINVAGELSEHKKIDGQKFKDVVVGDLMTGQFKNGQPFKFRPIATHWFGSNHKPTTNDFTDGFNRRWLIIEFKHRIRDSERIVDLGNILVAEEREAIVAWAVQAMSRLQSTQGYTLPASHKELISEVAHQNNSVLYFLREGGMVQTVPPAPEGGSKTTPHISETKLYEMYSNFCFGKKDAKHVGLLPFRTRMRELESEMKFRIISEKNQYGLTVVNYFNLTPVGLKAA